MTTSLIIRPSNIPPVRVLEVDGPRRKHYRREEGYYYLATDNQPACDEPELRVSDGRRGGILRDWDQPHWEIYQKHDGTVEIHACRPSHQEVMRGDLHGRWGSVIHLGTNPTRRTVRIGLQLARILCRCIPTIGFTVNPMVLFHVTRIETEIPVKSSTGVVFSHISKAS